MRRPSPPPLRWPLSFDGAPAAPLDRGRRALSFGVSALLYAAALLPLALPLAARAVLAVLGLLPLAYGLFGTRRRAETRSGTWVESDAAGLARVSGDERRPILAWSDAFGVTLLASYGRSTGLLAFTTKAQTRYIPTRIACDEADEPLLAEIAVLADLDLVEGLGHEAALTSAAAAELVRHVRARDEAALGRVYLSDGKGTPIALDRATLAVGDRNFDLTSQLEWRPLMFHESTGQAAALYQATWIRQASAEVVLVAPMPASIVPRDASRDATGKLARALTRDLRLLQAPSETPPARDLRVAIDRPFMMAVRRALDDAPLALRIVAEPPPRPRSENRAH